MYKCTNAQMHKCKRQEKASLNNVIVKYNGMIQINLKIIYFVKNSTFSPLINNNIL